MDSLTRFARSSIGAKLIMAATGLVLFAFVVGHLVGNLQVFQGPDVFNGYAHFLKARGGLLWAVRLGMLAVFVVHIAAALRLTTLNKAARPVRYVKEDTVKATRASRSMVFSGMTILAYVLYHLAHFTVGLLHPDFYALKDADGQQDVYSMLVFGFQQGWVSLIYLVSMVILAMHLSHGVSSFFQTVGFNHPRYNLAVHRFGTAVAVIIAAGYISIPLAVLAGLVDLPDGVTQ